jgi:molybdenum cofactor synthesis domain-containing protein
MSNNTLVRAAMVIIGNEILSGRTQDINLQYLAKGLNDVGIRLAEVRVVPDIPEAIVGAVNALRSAYDYVFTTGGIGPTHDDITAECVARAFGRPLIRNPEAMALLEAHYRRTGREFNEARMRMANTPEGATLIANPVSTAPGFQVENVYVMAGVPVVMQAMLDGLKPQLKGGQTMLSRSVGGEVGEGIIAQALGGLQARYPDIDIGSYPFYRPGGVAGTNVVMRHTDAARLDKAIREAADLIRSHGGEPVYAEEG